MLGKTLARLAEKLWKDFDGIGFLISLHVYPFPMVAAHQSMHNLTLLKLQRSSSKKIQTYTASEGITLLQVVFNFYYYGNVHAKVLSSRFFSGSGSGCEL